MTFDLRSDFKVANTGVIEPFEGMVFRWRQGILQGWIILGFEDARAPPPPPPSSEPSPEQRRILVVIRS